MRLARASTVLGIGAVLAAAPLYSQENEPNDSPATATPVERGTSRRATISPFDQATFNRDFDYWKITANAGETIFVDIDANEFGSPMDMGLVLYGSDGTTLLASNNNWDGMDPHLEYVATTTGTYYVLAGTSLTTTPNGTAQPYTIHFFEVKCPATGDAEPNNSPQTATKATIGHEIRGMSCPSDDVDYFAFDLAPGTYEFIFEMDPHERPAFGSAGEIAGLIELYAPDSTTKLYATDGERVPDRIEYTVRTRGTYFLRADIWPGGIRYTYKISSRLMSGPVAGDPITQRADLAMYWSDDGAVVDRNGDMLVSALISGIWRVSLQGAKTKVAASVEFPAGLAWDADKNLLIVNVTGGYSNASTAGGVFKLAPNGQLTRFITDARVSGAIAMSPDGSMWLAANSAKALLHYDEHGNMIAAYTVGDVTGTDGPRHVAVGPSGDPYFSTWLDLFRLRNGRAERIIHYDHTANADPTPPDIGAFAFDAQGNIYIPNGAAGVVNLHDATGRWLETISYEPTAPSRIFFGRNSDGSMNSRLFAIDGAKVIELNGGARAPGLPVQFDRQQAPQEPPIAEAERDVLRGGALSDAQRRDLDQRGNQNGRYDVGDLRALLIRIGILIVGPSLIPR